MDTWNDADEGMKVLIVTTNQTHPVDAGNRAAIMAQVNVLEKMRHEVHCVFANMSLRKDLNLSPMREYWGNRFHQYDVPFPTKVRRLLTDKVRTTLCGGYWKKDDHYPFGVEKFINGLQEAEHYDAVIIQYMRLSKLLSLVNIPHKAIFTHDVFAYKDIRTGAPFYETCNAKEEAEAIQRCPNVFAIQEEEAAYFRYISPSSKVYTVFCPYEFHDLPLCHNKIVLFLASRMEFNVNGIKWFLDNVWDSVLEREPDARLIIGGSVCEKIEAGRFRNVELLGYVESLTDFYGRGDIVINPVFRGTGLKIKTFEALSYGKAVIINPHSTIGVFDREHLPAVICNEPDEWRDAIISLLDGNGRDKYREKGKCYINRMNDFIEERYNTFLNRDIIV